MEIKYNLWREKVKDFLKKIGLLPLLLILALVSAPLASADRGGDGIEDSLDIVTKDGFIFVPGDQVEDKNKNKTEDYNYLTDGEWLYWDREDYICICGYEGNASHITIPKEINGKKVKEIRSHPEMLNVMAGDLKTIFFFDRSNKNTVWVTIPEGVISIGDGVFKSSGIERADLPQSLRYIGEEAFADCEELESIEIPKNVKIIGTKAFSYCKLKEVILNEGLESIGHCAFEKTVNLKHIRIPDSVSYIGEGAFQGGGLEEITLPPNIVTVPTNLFNGCLELKTAYFSEGTVRLESDVFYACQRLESVYLPSTLIEINGIFRYFDSLKSIYVAMSEEEIGLRWGKDALDILTGQRDYRDPEDNGNVRLIPDTPVPPQRERAGAKTDIGFILFWGAITLFCAAGGVILTVKLIKGKYKPAGSEEEQPKQIISGSALGEWQCGKCKTTNSSIANYCYSCGRRREK